MVANALVRARTDAEVRDLASAVLENMGLIVSDAVRILLTRTAIEGALPQLAEIACTASFLRKCA